MGEWRFAVAAAILAAATGLLVGCGLGASLRLHLDRPVVGLVVAHTTIGRRVSAYAVMSGSLVDSLITALNAAEPLSQTPQGATSCPAAAFVDFQIVLVYPTTVKRFYLHEGGCPVVQEMTTGEKYWVKELPAAQLWSLFPGLNRIVHAP